MKPAGRRAPGVGANRAVAIVGLGRVGLPLGLYLADRGFQVYGIDIRQELIDQLLAHQMPFIEAGAGALLEKYVPRRLKPTTDPAAISRCRTVILTLGTPVDEHINPVYDQLTGAVRGLLPHLRAGQLLVLRSTVSPGTTALLRRFLDQHTPLRVGRDLFLAFCPERIAEGHSLEELPEIPQIVGSDDAASQRRAVAFFRPIAPQVLAGRSIEAELAKLFCNMYRYIDFAIANEFMMIADTYEADIYRVLRLANQGYKRAGLKSPGLTSGPCLYKDGFFLVNRIPFAELISLSWRIHETTPAYLIERIKRHADLREAKVAILGMAFKREIDDVRNSLAFKARKILIAEGASVVMHDPYVPSASYAEALRGASVVLIAMNHAAYRRQGRAMLLRHAPAEALVCDIWNLLGRGILYRVGDLKPGARRKAER